MNDETVNVLIAYKGELHGTRELREQVLRTAFDVLGVKGNLLVLAQSVSTSMTEEELARVSNRILMLTDATGNPPFAIHRDQEVRLA